MILVTGGAGFIGSHVVNKFIQEGVDVIIYDKLQHTDVKQLKELRFPDIEPKIVSGDITDFEHVFQTLKKYEVDKIINTAAITVIPVAIKNPSLAFNVNTVGTFNLLESGRILNIDKFVHISSASAYGDYQYVPVDEKHPLDAKDIYGGTKAAADRIAMSYYRTYDLPTTIIRTTAVYGPGDLENRVVKQFIEKALQGISLELHGGGEQRRDFTYVKDVANAIILAFNSHKTNGEVFNISSMPDYSIKELAIFLKEFIPNTKIKITGERGIDTKKGQFDTSKAKKMLGYESEYDLKRGLNETIKWYLNIYSPVFGIEQKNEVILE